MALLPNLGLPIPEEGGADWRIEYNAVLLALDAQLAITSHTHRNGVLPLSGQEPDDSRTLFEIADEYIVGSLVIISDLSVQVGNLSFEEDAGIKNLATASWVAATKKLTQANAFINYTFTSGDKININGGTGVTKGFFEIALKQDDSTIVLTLATLSGVDLPVTPPADITSKRAFQTIAGFVPELDIPLFFNYAKI